VLIFELLIIVRHCPSLLLLTLIFDKSEAKHQLLTLQSEVVSQARPQGMLVLIKDEQVFDQHH
jgi:hypothetical protein